jgi:hypothetical protein
MLDVKFTFKGVPEQMVDEFIDVIVGIGFTVIETG